VEEPFRRKHERLSLLADVVIQPGERNVHFAGRVFNISRAGMALFSKYHFPPEVLLTVELTVPLEGEGLRRVTLCGVTRWGRVESDGAVMGIEFLPDAKVGDFTWFIEHFDLCVGAAGVKRPGIEARSDR
jgi:hypothetical protein